MRFSNLICIAAAAAFAILSLAPSGARAITYGHEDCDDNAINFNCDHPNTVSLSGFRLPTGDETADLVSFLRCSGSLLSKGDAVCRANSIIARTETETASSFLAGAIDGPLVSDVPDCGGGDAPPAPPAATQQAVDRIVTQQLTAQNLPGAVVLISIPGQGEMVKAYGIANLQTQTPRSAADPFRIASITKTFIGTVVLQLVDDGALALTDRVSKWYPSFPNGDAITIDHLLRMRSGIADSMDEDLLAELYANPTAVLTQQEMIDRAAARADEFVPPDTVTRYTNVNFVLLDEIAAKVAGQDIRTLLHQRIFAPLGMAQTVYPLTNELGGANRGYLFNPDSGQIEDLTVLNTVGVGGAGALISTLADLKPYARALCTGTLLKQETQEQRLRGRQLEGEPPFVQYAGGLVKLGRFCGHNGTIFGFSSEMFYLPERDAVVIINVNRLDLDDHSQSTELFLLLTKELFPKHVDW